jgi:hypothetical protein
MGERSGFRRSKGIIKVQNELLSFDINNTINLSRRDRYLLRLATTLHNVADIESRREFKTIFAKHINVSKESLSPILTGLKKNSMEKVLYEAYLFNSALKKPHEKLWPFHDLIAAMFAYNALKDELGNVDAKIAAWAILFHHESNLKLIPDISIVQLLRDTVKLEGLEKKSLTGSIARNMTDLKRPFFNPDIPLNLRIEALEGRNFPEKQAYENPELTFDAFHFAMKLLFHDTDPNMFALPKLAEPYLREHKLFNEFMGVIINAADICNKTTDLQIRTLDMLKALLQTASRNGRYKKNIDLIRMGVKTVNGSLHSVIKWIDGSLTLYSSNASISYADLLLLKAKALDILGNTKESDKVKALAYLHRGIMMINGNKPDRSN